MIIAELTEQEVETMDSLKSMIDSCYAYGGAKKDSPNFDRYIKPYQDRIDIGLFWMTYHNRLQALELDYEVVVNSSTGSDGLTYNSLVRRK